MSRKAFTLIELLVVIAVLALLASIVFSNLGGAREGARISNALSFQSQTHSLLGSDLVGWWNFNEGSGSVARDISGYGNDGTIVGATYVDGVPGTGGSALSFDGEGDYLQAQGLSEVRRDGIFFTAWILFSEDAIKSGTIFQNSHGSANRNGMRITTSGNIQFGYYDGSSWHGASGNESLGRWIHVSGINNEGSLSLYLNGEIQSGAVEPYVHSSQGLFLGKVTIDDRSDFNSLIDDVRIYSRALTA